MRYLNLMTFLLMQSAVLLQAGCGQFKPGEIVEGNKPDDRPGLFSGEKGHFEF